MDPTVNHIYLFGDVENVQSESASEWGVVSLSTVKAAIDAMPSAEEIVVHIHSRGGDVDEGFAIHDFLKATGKKITTVTEGVCASIATVIFLAGSRRKMTSNATFFIHNPWTFGVGNADQLEKTAEDVRVMEDKMIDFYVAKTGADRDQLSGLMSEESSLTPEKALELKFITEIIDEVAAKVKARVYAKFNPKTIKPMNVIDEIKALLKKSGVKAEVIETPPVVKNLDLKLKGEEDTLHVATEATEPAIGDQATYKGAATPDKTYELEDGRKIKTDADSKIVDIVPVEKAPVAAEVLAAKEKEITDLKKKVEEMETAQAAITKTVTEQKAELEGNAKAFVEIKAGLAALTAGTKSGFKAEGDETRFSTKAVHTDNVTDAVARYKKQAENRRLGKKAGAEKE